jgi:hypothetical protein
LALVVTTITLLQVLNHNIHRIVALAPYNSGYTEMLQK